MSKQPGFFSRIKQLSFEQQLTFAAVMTERMLPNYRLFSEATEFGEPRVLQTMLDLIWQRLCKQQIKINLPVQIEKLAELTPEQRDFDCYGVYPAIDAAMAVHTMLVAMEQQLTEDLINISKLSSATVAQFIRTMAEEELSDDELFQHEMMTEEKALQGYLLERIEELGNAKADALKTLRKEFKEFGVSNIGIAYQ